MKYNKKIRQVIDDALEYLAIQQQPDGSFISYSSSQQDMLTVDFVYHTTFTPALILAALSKTDTPASRNIRTQLADFLLQQKSTLWSFNYWVRQSGEAKLMPYPDDLDDTFCALSALWLHEPTLIDEVALARMVKLLIATEAEVGGPYRTWLVPADSGEVWRDVDVAVNANIAFFLSKVSRSLPNMTALMEQAIGQRRFYSPYYPHEYPVIYFMARAYYGPYKQQLADYLLFLRHQDGTWGTPLKTSLAITSLLQLGDYNLDEAVHFLLHSQLTDGSWVAEAFCIDPKRDGTSLYSGVPTLTTAFAIEALQMYYGIREDVSSSRTKVNLKTHLFRTQVVKEVIKEMKSLNKDLHFVARDMLTHMVEGKNGKEVILLPQLFYNSLQRQPRVSEELFTSLGKANLYGWMAYTIYDDFLDNEGIPQLLSVANMALRRSVDAFRRALPDDSSFRDLVDEIFDVVDAANTWEAIHCRFEVKGDTILIGELPAYGRLSNLAERSLGHALTPLGVLAKVGIPPDTPAAQSLLRALRHYLIARQLSDDIHDWQADLKAGRITYVLVRIFEESALQSGEYCLQDIISRIERGFWQYAVLETCKRMSYHTRQSRKALAQSKLLKQNNIIEQLLDKIDDSIEETYVTLTRAKRFLQAYGDENTLA